MGVLARIKVVLSAMAMVVCISIPGTGYLHDVHLERDPIMSVPGTFYKLSTLLICPLWNVEPCL